MLWHNICCMRKRMSLKSTFQPLPTHKLLSSRETLTAFHVVNATTLKTFGVASKPFYCMIHRRLP